MLCLSKTRAAVLGLAGALGLVVGCSPDGTSFEPNLGTPDSYEAFAFKHANNPGPGERITYLSGFSFTAPPGENWIEGPRELPPDPKYHGLVHRLGFLKLFPQEQGAPPHSAGADVLTMFPAYKPPDAKDFMRFRLSATMTADKVATNRRTLSQKGDLDNSIGYECFKYEIVFENKNVAGYKDVSFTVNVHLMECIAPSGKMLVRLRYGQMTPPGVEPADINEEGEQFFKSLRFSDDAVPEATLQGSKADRLPSAPVGDRSIILGERIGPIRLSDNISVVSKLFGAGVEKRPGIWPWSSLFTWEPLGLWIIADQETGNILWLSIDERADKRWAAEFASQEGIRLGINEKSVRDILGEPEKKFSGGGSTSYYYDRRGVRVTFMDTGPFAGIVGSLRIVWPAIPRGDATIVPGSRISSVEIGMPSARAFEALGGGYGKYELQGLNTYYWPHLGLAFIEKDMHVAAVRAATELQDPLIHYLTPERLGLGSTRADVTTVYGKPTDVIVLTEGFTTWMFRPRGISFTFDQKSMVRSVEVFAAHAYTADVGSLAFFEHGIEVNDPTNCQRFQFC